jgi:hypothetical protein
VTGPLLLTITGGARFPIPSFGQPVYNLKMDERKTSAGLWVVVTLVALFLAYPALFGPAVWLTSREFLPRKPVVAVYWPMVSLCFNDPKTIATPLRWYAQLGRRKPDGELVMLGIEGRVLRGPESSRTWWQR